MVDVTVEALSKSRLVKWRTGSECSDFAILTWASRMGSRVGAP